MRYIEDLRDNESVEEHYHCKYKQSLKTKTGKAYLSLKLSDKTGVIDAKVWDMSKDVYAFEEGDIVKVVGEVQVYQNEKQIKVAKIRKSREGEYVTTHYIASTDKDVNVLYKSICDLVQSIENLHIRQLVETILIKDIEKANAFRTHCAAKYMHHSYMGGLLEHTLAVTQICDFLSTRYKHVNRDILIATALLHDIGKIYELGVMPHNEYTNDGQLLGHIIIGLEMITNTIANIQGFSPELASLIKHSIIAHHGELEFGSPKLPYTAEAYLLHFADNMDAKLKSFEEILDKDNTPGPWAGFQKALNRHVRSSSYV